jgi:hypothetical protein
MALEVQAFFFLGNSSSLIEEEKKDYRPLRETDARVRTFKEPKELMVK